MSPFRLAEITRVTQSPRRRAKAPHGSAFPGGGLPEPARGVSLHPGVAKGRHGVVPEPSPPLSASLKTADHAVLERAGSSQAANSGRADVEQPGNVGLRLAPGDALQRLGALMRCELARPAEAHTALLGPLAALA